MSVSALSKLCTATTETTEYKYDTLIRESEQLRILKNYIKLETTYKKELENLIKAMEGEANDG